MPATLEEITRQVLELPARQRLALAGLLLEMHEVSHQPGVDEVWEQEIRDRIEAVDRGTETGISHHDVMREAERRLAR